MAAFTVVMCTLVGIVGVILITLAVLRMVFCWADNKPFFDTVVEPHEHDYRKVVVTRSIGPLMWKGIRERTSLEARIVTLEREVRELKQASKAQESSILALSPRAAYEPQGLI